MPSATLIEKCCLIANPIAGNPTQYMIEPALLQQGLEWRFMSFEVEPARLGDAVRGLRALGFHGIKVDEPFHEPIIEYLDDLSEVARRCGSANCVTADGERLNGDNTEGLAFIELLRQHLNPAGAKAIVVGAGRIARALALALADAGASSIAIVARNESDANKLVTLIQQHSTATAFAVSFSSGPITIASDTGVLVNATSLAGGPPSAKLPLNVDSLDPKLVVVDMDYNTFRTRLMQQAAERGCRIIDGLSLYVQQTALAVRAWTGKMPDTAAMRDAAEEFLGI